MIEIIPAIDLMDGRCVRLTRGDYGQRKDYFDDPLDAALIYADAGLRRLHMVDLDGARRSEPANLAVLERVASRTGLDIQWGGGIKSRRSLAAVLDSGASRAICGSVAVTAPDEFAGWLTEFGGGRIILGADIRDGMVATHGWLRGSDIKARQLIERFTGAGLSQVVCTEISRDGMLAGPALEVYDELQGAFPGVDITVSGGVSGMGDIVELNKMGMRSVIVGKAIYEGRITMDEIKKFIR